MQKLLETIDIVETHTRTERTTTCVLHLWKKTYLLHSETLQFHSDDRQSGYRSVSLLVRHRGNPIVMISAGERFSLCFRWYCRLLETAPLGVLILIYGKQLIDDERKSWAGEQWAEFL